MERYLVDEWNVIEKEFNPAKNRLSESIMSLGNGYMGIRETLQSFILGIHLKEPILQEFIILTKPV